MTFQERIGASDVNVTEAGSRRDIATSSARLNPIQGATSPKLLSHNGDTSGAISACTNACTDADEAANAGNVEALAAALQEAATCAYWLGKSVRHRLSTLEKWLASRRYKLGNSRKVQE
jgi:hypothetical protein